MTPFERRIWLAALAAFVVAALTGVWFRGVIYMGWQTDLFLPNVRHAHSHLMYFTWATPVLMLLITRACPNAPVRGLRRARIAIASAAILGALAYIPFLRDGYALADIGGVKLPISITLSTANLFAWYAFAWLYKGLRLDLDSALARPFLDAAVVFLAVSSLGAWALGATVAVRPSNPIWYSLALHLFMDVFALGWLLMATLGFLVRRLESHLDRSMILCACRLMVVGIPATFVLGIHPNDLSPLIRLIGSFGAILVALGLGLLLYSTWRPAPRPWRLPLSLVALQAVGLFGLAIPRLAAWGFASGLRIPYLHLVLLGIVTPAIVAAVGDIWGMKRIRGWSLLQIGSVLLLLSLLPLLTIWPAALRGPWTGWIVVIGAAAPAVGALALMAMARD